MAPHRGDIAVIDACSGPGTSTGMSVFMMALEPGIQILNREHCTSGPTYRQLQPAVTLYRHY